MKADPSISFSSDPRRALAAYEARGYHVEPELWTEAECAMLIEHSHRLGSYTKGVTASVINPHLEDERFLTAMKKPKLLSIIERLVGGKASGLQTSFFYGPPGALGFSLHQDNFFIDAKPDAFASAWSALEDIGPENGGLIVYPGSHREPVLPVRECAASETGITLDPNANKVETVLPERYLPLHLRVKAGSVVFLHSHLVHGSNRNASESRFRHVLLSTYIRSGEKFRAGNYAKRTEIQL